MTSTWNGKTELRHYHQPSSDACTDPGCVHRVLHTDWHSEPAREALSDVFDAARDARAALDHALATAQEIEAAHARAQAAYKGWLNRKLQLTGAEMYTIITVVLSLDLMLVFGTALAVFHR